MRKIVILSFISLDGVMQAPGGPDEDTSSGFKYGGWTHPYFDDFAGKIMQEQMDGKFEYLLGRKTFEIFASYWPKHPQEWLGINNSKKYVVSNTLTKYNWENTEFIGGDVVDKIKKIKQTQGPNLQVHGSGNLIQTLLKNDLVNEMWLKIFPVILGSGKKLFAQGSIPVGFKLIETKVSPLGVIFANYMRSGEVKTGSFA